MNVVVLPRIEQGPVSATQRNHSTDFGGRETNRETRRAFSGIRRMLVSSRHALCSIVLCIGSGNSWCRKRHQPHWVWRSSRYWSAPREHQTVWLRNRAMGSALFAEASHGGALVIRASAATVTAATDTRTSREQRARCNCRCRRLMRLPDARVRADARLPPPLLKPSAPQILSQR